MTDDFDDDCDRLSSAIDSIQFERIRWARTEGPMLDALVALAQSAINGRSEFEFSEEGSSGACRRFVLKVHSFRIAAVNIALDGQDVTMWGEAIERGRGQVASTQRETADYAAIDETWMKAALRRIFNDIRFDERQS
ncbi:MAG: hypothetical protein ABIT09_02775 [Croceibacterium sp.]